uniref:Heavy metal efflux pump CzcA family protein n=1 Tax=Aetherobacter rufus TaxID=888831 RepID=A0A3Q8I1L5_9BACT|nr:heavy metal efflux pump CzcA family protein [Aetherobacter rufus]
MIGGLVNWSLRNRLLVFLAAAALAVLGVRGYLDLPVDAVPDVTSVQVQVLTSAPGLSPLEVESLVTRPIELSLAGLPGAEMVRSVSRTAVSAVTIVFRDGTELAAARELVAQRLSAAREAIPPGAGRPEMGPMSTGLGEIYHFTMRWPGHTARDLRTLLDWEVARALRQVPGVVEVNGWGGDSREIEVRLRTADLRALGVGQSDVEEALLGAGSNAGGGALERDEELVLVRLDGQLRTAAEVAEQVVAVRPGGLPILVRDVATVRDGAAPRIAAATADGDGETQYAMVQMIAGGNAHAVVGDVKARVEEVRKRLPEGVTIEPFYDRASFVDRVLHTVWKSLFEGGAVVVVVLLIFLGDIGAGLVVATVIPLSMLGVFALMRATGMSGNLMSLGAIDFGLVVDGAVVIVEGALATMAAERITATRALGDDAQTFGKPIAFGVFIIGVVYVPVLLLEGVEGKMFRPMAFSVLFALGTALVLTFTWIPALGSLVLRKIHDGDPLVIKAIRRAYRPLLDALTRRRGVAVALAAALLVAGVLAGSRLGADFVPRLEEGDVVVQVTRPPSVSLAEAIRGTQTIERTLRGFPEVLRVVSRTGSPDVATDIMGIEQSDVFVILKPKGEWTTAHDRQDLVSAFDAALRRSLPGTVFSFTQPIEMRIQELLGGSRSDVGIKIFGDDLQTLKRLAAEVTQATAATPGAADVRAEPSEGLPLATIRPDAAAMGRLGVRSEALRAAVEALRAGRVVGVLADGERRFPITVRADAPPTSDIEALADTPLALAGGRTVALGEIARLRRDDAPAQLSREMGRRRVLVEANVRGRDLASFVGDLSARLDGVPRPAGYYFEITGQYQNLVRASQRLAVIVPATLLTIFVLLYLTFGAARPALLILLNVPVAASGGLVALAARGLPFSISAGVGLIALFGVATMNGVVLLSAVRRLEERGEAGIDAIHKGAHDRLRPVLTTAVVASLGFLPMALATGTGAEVQRPLATVVIGGLVTATALTLLLLPALYLKGNRSA